MPATTPGRLRDRYDMGARRVMRRAIDDTPLTQSFVDSLFAATDAFGCTSS